MCASSCFDQPPRLSTKVRGDLLPRHRRGGAGPARAKKLARGPECRHDPDGRHGLRGHWQLWCERRQDTQCRPIGSRGSAARRRLRKCVELLADPRWLHHRPVSAAVRHRVAPWLPSGRFSARVACHWKFIARSAEEDRLRDRAHRKMAPRVQAGVQPECARVRRILWIRERRGRLLHASSW